MSEIDEVQRKLEDVETANVALRTEVFMLQQKLSIAAITGNSLFSALQGLRLASLEEVRQLKAQLRKP